jgi:hypothetical protein
LEPAAELDYILGAGGGAGFPLASKNEVLEARKEAVQNLIEPGITLASLRKIIFDTCCHRK